jgi:hypothetical protein
MLKVPRQYMCSALVTHEDSIGLWNLDRADLNGSTLEIES